MAKLNIGEELLNGLSSSIGGLPGSIIGSGLSSLFQGSQMNKQFNNQKKLMDYQSKLQKDMMQYNWNNQYGAQVQGMKGAGLNPAIMQGGSFGLNSAPSVSGGSASVSPVQVPSIAENALLASQKANVDADTKLKESEANKNKADTRFQELQSDAYEASFDSHVKAQHGINYKNMQEGREAEAREAFIRQSMDNLKTENDILLEDLESKKISNETLRERMQLIIDNMKKDLKLKDAQVYSLYTLANSTAKLNASIIKYNEAKTAEVKELLPYEKDLKEALIGFYTAQKELFEENLKYVPAEKIVGMIGNFLGSLASAFFGVAAVKGAARLGGAALGGAAKSSTIVKGLN